MNKPEKNGEKIIIVGAGELAEIAYEYFTYDSPYEVVAFTVEHDYIIVDKLYDLPVVSLEEVQNIYPSTEFKAFVAIPYTSFNRLRTRLYTEMKNKGYAFVTYISSKAFVWRNVTVGENCFIFENNVLQHHVHIGNNVILWSGNHIGHRSVIKDNVFISSHVVVAGNCEIGENSFLGLNSTVNDDIKIEKDCFIASGALINKHTEQGKAYAGVPAKPLTKDSFSYFEAPNPALMNVLIK